MHFKEIDFSDAKITKVFTNGENLAVNFDDWQEKQHTLTFMDVVGFQSFSPEGQELSNGVSDEKDSFIVAACEAAQEDSPDDFQFYRLISPWTEKSILTVVARSFTYL